MALKRRILNEIIASLRKNPENWTFDKHTARHKQLPIEIWTSNRYYGTKWSFGVIHSTYSDSDLFWMLKPWQWWRVTLIREVEKAQAKLLGNYEELRYGR